MTFFLGGREVAALGEGSTRSVGRTFVRRLDGITPGIEAASTDKFLRTRWSRSRFTRGGYANFIPGQLARFGGLLWIESEDAEERQEVHAGNLVFAGEHLSERLLRFHEWGRRNRPPRRGLRGPAHHGADCRFSPRI